MTRCRCWRRQYRVVWTGFGRYILVREKCEMHRKRDEMTERLIRETRLAPRDRQTEDDDGTTSNDIFC